MTTVLDSLGLEGAEEVAKEVMKAADADGSGDLDFDEFADVLSIIEQGGLDQSFRLLFCGFDKNDDGFIDQLEFLQLFKFLEVPVSDDENRQLFANADTNGDGRISPAEALSALNGL